MEGQNTNNVVNLADRRYALFHPHLRAQLEENVKPYTESPSQTVQTVESTICNYLIGAVRRGAASLAEKLGQKITSQTERAFNE